MYNNIFSLFNNSKHLKDGVFKPKQISKIIANLPNNDYCYNDLEIVIEIDKRSYFRYFKDILVETNLFYVSYSKFGYYVPNYLRIIGFFSFVYFHLGFVILFNIYYLNRTELANVKVRLLN